MTKKLKSSGLSNVDWGKERFEALKSLSYLLLREIDTFEGMGSKTTSGADTNRISLNDEVAFIEATLIRCALIRSEGNQTQAAKLLSMKLTTLHEKIKRYRIAADGPPDTPDSVERKMETSN